MQTIGNGAALRAPLRFARPQPAPQAAFAFLERYFTPRTVFMEIGAADCQLALQAAGYVERVYAVDLTGQFLHSELLPCNLRLVVCDALHIPVPEASVDVAWSGRFLEQLRPDERLEHLRGVRRALAPGGVYVTSSRADFARAGFSSVQVYYGRLRIPGAASRFFPPEELRYAAR